MKVTAAMMLKAPRPGRVKTRLAAEIGTERAVELYRMLAERQIRRIPGGWECSIHFAPGDAEAEIRVWLAGVAPSKAAFHPQCSGELGERMRHAVCTELGAGAGAVALIGGDCPGLSTEVLLSVEAAAEGADLVIVPATDGGYVLLLLKADHPQLFQGIDWSTDRVFRQTLAAARASGLSVALLPLLDDVDDSRSLERLS